MNARINSMVLSMVSPASSACIHTIKARHCKGTHASLPGTLQEGHHRSHCLYRRERVVDDGFDPVGSETVRNRHSHLSPSRAAPFKPQLFSAGRPTDAAKPPPEGLLKQGPGPLNAAKPPQRAI